MRIRLVDAKGTAARKRGGSDSLVSNTEMILRRYLIASTIVVACIAAWTSAGCREQQTPHATATDGKTTPEASFAEIVRLVADGVDLEGVSTSTGFVSQDDRASSRFQVSNEVTSKLIPPGEGNNTYRGTITVTSSSTYSLRRSADDSSDKKDQDHSNKDNGFGSLDDSSADSGFESMDKQLVSAAPAGDKPGAESIESVQRRTAKDVRTYELAYEHDRWVLKTELDPETERSIANAFDRALRLQP
jgi:hypothetical protein